MSEHEDSTKAFSFSLSLQALSALTLHWPQSLFEMLNLSKFIAIVDCGVVIYVPDKRQVSWNGEADGCWVLGYVFWRVQMLGCGSYRTVGTLPDASWIIVYFG
jgi:hypothetical protein